DVASVSAARDSPEVNGGTPATGSRVAATTSGGAGDPDTGGGVSAIGDQPLILLVEDNEELNQFVAEELGKSYRLISAYNGVQALELAREKLPDLVVSDVMMPEMDGYALCQALKEDPATDHIAVMLLSAKASHES